MYPPLLCPDGASVAINATQAPAAHLLNQHRRLAGSGVHVATTVTYRVGSSGQALNFTAGLKRGAPWLTSAYPGASVSNIQTGPVHVPPPRQRLQPPPLPR